MAGAPAALSKEGSAFMDAEKLAGAAFALAAVVIGGEMGEEGEAPEEHEEMIGRLDPPVVLAMEEELLTVLAIDASAAGSNLPPPPPPPAPLPLWAWMSASWAFLAWMRRDLWACRAWSLSKSCSRRLRASSSSRSSSSRAACSRSAAVERALPAPAAEAEAPV